MGYAAINRGKANFDNIYNNDTPFLYFRAMKECDYRIPDTGIKQGYD